MKFRFKYLTSYSYKKIDLSFKHLKIFLKNILNFLNVIITKILNLIFNNYNKICIKCKN